MYKYKAKHFKILDEDGEITKDVIKKCSNAYNKNKRFFQKDCGVFQIRIANTEEEFKKLAGKFYKVWVKGVGKKVVGKKEGLVAIRSPELYSECYKRHGGTPEFEMLLAHEINHIFANQSNLYKGPYWFTEGLAMYVAGQIPGKTYKRKADFTKDKTRFYLFYRLIMKRLSDEMYIPQYYAVKYIVDKFGKVKLLRLMKSYSKNMNKLVYEKNFKKIYGFSYNQFLDEFVESFNYS